MSTILNTSHSTPIAPFKHIRIQNLEGNWNEYRRQSARCRNADRYVRDSAGLLDDSRACALAYLGKRAQFHGGVGSKLAPRILTPQLTAKLETNNRAKRFGLYPWMETLMKLTDEIERIQDEISNPVNVISLLPATTCYRNAPHPGDQLSRISIRSSLPHKLPR